MVDSSVSSENENGSNDNELTDAHCLYPDIPPTAKVRRAVLQDIDFQQLTPDAIRCSAHVFTIANELVQTARAFEGDNPSSIRDYLLEAHGYSENILQAAIGLLMASELLEVPPVLEVVLAAAKARPFQDPLCGIALHLENLLEASTDTPEMYRQGVRHDVNNLAMGAIGALDFAEMHLRRNNQEKVFAHLASANKLVMEISHLVNTLTELHNAEAHRPVLLNVRLFLRSLKPLLSALDTEQQHHLSITVPSESLLAYVDTIALTRILLNLVSNAFQALEEPGEVSVEMRLLHKNDAPYMQIDVVDTGTGLHEQHLARVFEPYFTLNKERGGTGIGMVVVQQMAERLNAELSIASRHGTGTTVSLCVPVQTREPQLSAYDTSHWKRLYAGEGHVLVADDEHSVRSTVQLILESLGYSVAVHDGGEAVIKQLENGVDAHLVIADASMPYGALDIQKHLREQLVSRLPLLIMSGADLQVPADPDTIFLKKPFNASDLAREVHSAIRRATGLHFSS